MRDLRPWETRRLGPHHYVTRPWRPHEDGRVQAAVALLVAAVVVAAVWRLQGEAGLVSRKAVATLTTLLSLWVWRSWRARRT